MDNVTRRNNFIEQVHSCHRDGGLVVKFDHDRQVDGQPQDICGVHFAFAAEARYSTKHDNTVNAMPIVQNVQDLLHERLAEPMVGLFQINPYDDDFVIHMRRTYKLRAM